MVTSVRDPLLSQTEPKLQVPVTVVGAPQLVPSMFRLHATDAVELDEPQLPPPQVNVVVVSVREPLFAHALPYEQLPVPTVVVPHVAPSVFRAHPALSTSVPELALHEPPPQL